MKRSQNKDDNKRQRKYRKDGSQVQFKSFSPPEGPGIFVTCVRGKEKQATYDIIDILNDICDTYFPDVKVQPRSKGVEGEGDGEGGKKEKETENTQEESAAPQSTPATDDIKAELAAELEEMNKDKDKNGVAKDIKRFVNHPTDTQCMIYLEVRRPFNPVHIVEAYLDQVSKTGKMRTKYIQRLTPVQHTAHASENAFEALCAFTFQNWLDASTEEGVGGNYRIELRTRSHNTLKRDFVIQKVVDSISAPHRIDLSNPDRWLIVEIFKGVVGVAVVSTYDKYRKYNPFSIVEAMNKERVGGGEKKEEEKEKKEEEKTEKTEKTDEPPSTTEEGEKSGEKSDEKAAENRE